MKEVFGMTVYGVYAAERPEAFASASEGPSGKARYAILEPITEDGTIPFKVVLHYIADPFGLVWKKEEEQSRTCCFMLDALYITPIHFVGQHPQTV